MVFKSGEEWEQSGGNPNGRPKGQTLKEWMRTKLIAMSDEEREAFIKKVPESYVWAMAEGRPDTKADITSGGESLKTFVVKFVHSAKDTEELNKLEDEQSTKLISQ